VGRNNPHLRRCFRSLGVVSSRISGAANHVHLVVIPHNGDDLALALKHAHGRYAELNPVRAGLAIEAKSVDVVQCSRHCGNGSGNEILDLELWRNHWSASAWRQYLAAGEMESKLAAIRRCTTRGGRWAAQSLCRLSKGR
jgi:hypothetical protein